MIREFTPQELNVHFSHAKSGLEGMTTCTLAGDTHNPLAPATTYTPNTPVVEVESFEKSR